MLVKCLFCDADNDALSTGGYCDSCGKKLPPTSLLKPRRTLGGDAPEEPGERVPLPRRSKAVSEGLFAAAIVHLFAGGLFLIVGAAFYDKDKVPEQFAPNVLSWAIIPTLGIALLGLLARLTPMPAAILALVSAAVWTALTFVLSPALAVGWLLVDVILVAMLLWAASRGLRPEKRAAG